jgi:hypothetical protein
VKEDYEKQNRILYHVVGRCVGLRAGKGGVDKLWHIVEHQLE